jgi:hypothetical protein
VGDGSEVELKAKVEAERRGWVFDRVAGDMVLIRRLVEGDWESDFLIVQPGEQVKMTYDEGVIGCAAASA